MNTPSDFLSPSRLMTFRSCKRRFVQEYVFKKRPKPTAAMEKGHAFHALFSEAVLKPFSDFIEEPEFGDRRLKAVKEARASWILHNGAKRICTPDEYGALIALKTFFSESPAFEKAMRESAEKYKGVEREFESKKLKMRGRWDVLAPGFILEIKSMYKPDFLDRPSEFFKYKEADFTAQAAMYKMIGEDISGKPGLSVYFLAVCSAYPYGARMIEIEPNYLETISALISKKWAPQYFDFIDKIREALGRDPFASNEYRGEILKDWKALSRLLPGGLATASPAHWAMQDAELELGALAGTEA